MSIASEITRLQTAKSDMKTAIESKGVTVPSSASVSSYNTYINAITSANEVVNVSITDSDTGTVTVYNNDAGSTIATQSFSSATSFSFSIMGGINYTISISGSKIYLSASRTYVAKSGNIRNIIWTGLTNGVYIKYSDGSVSSYNSVVSGKTPAGVALITSNVKILIHPNLSSTVLRWAPYDYYTILIDGCFVSSNSTTAFSDFSGKTNTDAILSQLTAANAPAANWARNTCTYADGSIGYLPSMGEINEIYVNRVAINSALNSIGGQVQDSNKTYWTSTQYNQQCAWDVQFLGYSPTVYTTYSAKTMERYIRSVAAL